MPPARTNRSDHVRSKTFVLNILEGYGMTSVLPSDGPCEDYDTKQWFLEVENIAYSAES